MARRIRIQYAGALYHVVNRGDRDGPIFGDDADRETFLKTLDEACAKTSWRIHAYVLMPDHFHLVLRTPEANLVPGMQWLLGTFTSRFNVRHGQRGHLFAGRYKAAPIDPQGGYLQTAVEYVHLNPARSKLIQEHEPLRAFRWSSFGSYLEPNDARGTRPAVEPVATEFGGMKDGRKAARNFEQHMEWRRTLDLNEEFQGLRHGWYFGAESFRAELLARMDPAPCANHTGPELLQSAEARAEQVVARELERVGWSEQQLLERAKGDDKKIRIAELLRQESTMTLGWIAERLRMGTVGHLSHLLYWRRRGAKPYKRTRVERSSIARAHERSVRPPASTILKPRMPVGSTEGTSLSAYAPAVTFDPTFD